MKYKLFGNTGLRVSELALGTMTFGPEWGWGSTREESRKVFEKYAEAGGNFVDTANRYTDGTSEEFLGDFLAADRERFVLATKYTLHMRRDDPNAHGNHRKNMVQSLEASLRRLKTDYIDLFWVHAWDYMTPAEETMRALDDVVRAGKVLYIGVSDTPAWIVAHANTLAEQRGWTRFAGLQLRYSLIDRTIEREFLPMARMFDLAVTPWGALGGGVLTGKFNKDPEAEGRAKPTVNERSLAIAEAVIEVAKEAGCTPSQAALAWVRRQGPNIIPILGARKPEQLEDNLGCLDVSLSDAQAARLDEASRIERGFPHDFLAEERIQDVVYGGLLDKIENHHKYGY